MPSRASMDTIPVMENLTFRHWYGPTITRLVLGGRREGHDLRTCDRSWAGNGLAGS